MKLEWNHNLQYHRLILSAVPFPCAQALDVGCGEGLLTRLLADRCPKVTGLDLDTRMLAAAREHEACPSQIDYVAGDVMTYPLQPASFQFLGSVATLHHLPLEAALTRFGELLAPGGVLVIVGLYRARGFVDLAFLVAGYLASQLKRRFYRLQPMAAPMQDPRQTLGEIRAAASRSLPGSYLKRRLYFRYSLVWQKPRNPN